MSPQTLLWGLFALLVFGLLALDLGVLHRGGRHMTTRQAFLWSGVWISLALAFNGIVWAWLGGDKALEFLTAYVIEKSLSVDNVFIFLIVFTYFRVEPRHQYRVLFWGVLGAIVMRGVLIAVGVALIDRFDWIIYVFGAFLVFTGLRMLRERGEHVDPEKNAAVRLFRRLMPVTTDQSKGGFVQRQGGRLTATPLLLALVVVETSDLIFAVDSIPAVLAISTDTFIVYTSNVFAILGLRALYFALAGALRQLTGLKVGLSVILVFVGVKMLIADVYHVPVAVSLGVIVGVLSVTVLLSWWRGRRLAAAARRSAERMRERTGGGG